MPKIRKITIRNFRSIRRIEVVSPDLLVLVGDNDCGKSNLLRAINLFFNGETNPGQPFNFGLDYNKFVEPPARKAKEIQIELELELPQNYQRTNGQLIKWRKVWRSDGLNSDSYSGIRVTSVRGGRKRFTPVVIPPRSNVHSLLRRIRYEYVPAIRSAAYFRTLRGRIYGVIAEAAEGGFRERSTEFEAAIAESVERLLADISDNLEDSAELRLPNDLSSIFEQLDFLHPEGSISLDHRGDGIKARYIPLILKFIASKMRDLQGRGASPHTFIWAYEEPENNLEFRRAQELAETFVELSRDQNTQIFLTTHSPVFYNIALDQEGLSSTYFANNSGSNKGTVLQPGAGLGAPLDERMGVMSIVAPHIRRAQKELDVARQHAQRFREQAEAGGIFDRPVIFVEGATDYLIYQNILNRLRPADAARIAIVEPPQRAGANYVTNMLRSWEYRTRHVRVAADRHRAFGIVDGDAQGSGAATRFNGELRNAKYTRVYSLTVPEHLRAATESGFNLPITLEELLPEQEWQLAEGLGFLIERSTVGILSQPLVERMVDENLRFTDVSDPAFEIYIANQPDPNQKTEWAQRIVDLDDGSFAETVAEHFRVLEIVLEYLL